jgi:hypothetical protein
MGTWGEGLFDNDSVLDIVPEILEEAGLPDDGPRGQRDPALAAILGPYRTDLDARVRAAAKKLTTICGGVLDELDTDEDLYEQQGELGAGLGLLVLCGAKIPAARLERWRRSFDTLDRNTPDERDFWDAYAANVRAAFDRLA